MTANEILNEVVENAVADDKAQIFVVAYWTIGIWEQYKRLDQNGNSFDDTDLSAEDFHAGELLVDAGAKFLTALRGYFRREERVASLWGYAFYWNETAKKGLIAALKERFADDLRDGDSELSVEVAKSLREKLTETLNREKNYDGYGCSRTFNAFKLHEDDKDFGRIMGMKETLRYLLLDALGVAVRANKNITIRLEQNHETGAWLTCEKVEITPKSTAFDVDAITERFNQDFTNHPVSVVCERYEDAI